MISISSREIQRKIKEELKINSRLIELEVHYSETRTRTTNALKKLTITSSYVATTSNRSKNQELKEQRLLKFSI